MSGVGSERGGGTDPRQQPLSGGAAAEATKDTTYEGGQLEDSPISRAESWKGGGIVVGGGGTTTNPATDGRAAARQDQQQSGFCAEGRGGGWVEGDSAAEGEGASREMVGQRGQVEEEWDWNGGGPSGGGGRQASDRVVDEDAYRFRSFSEEVIYAWSGKTVPWPLLPIAGSVTFVLLGWFSWFLTVASYFSSNCVQCR